VESFLRPCDRLLTFVSLPSEFPFNLSSHGLENGVQSGSRPAGSEILSRTPSSPAAVSPASVITFPQSSRARPFLLQRSWEGEMLRRMNYKLELQPMVTREGYIPKLTKSATRRNTVVRPHGHLVWVSRWGSDGVVCGRRATKGVSSPSGIDQALSSQVFIASSTHLSNLTRLPSYLVVPHPSHP
jgi:hypothetical protein